MTSVMLHLVEKSQFWRQELWGLINEFLDLVSETGYMDNKTIVVKFCRGLDPRIQDAVTTMTSGYPSMKFCSSGIMPHRL